MKNRIAVDPEAQPCVIYARYSSHAQRDVSIEQQVADCEAYAKANGLRVVKVYADRHLSGTNDRRPQFQQMLRDAAHGRWSYVLTWKVDRFARNRYDSATYKYRLKRYGVRVIYAKESIPDGPEGILLESVLEGSAEYYSANLSQNITRGMRYNAMDCKVNNALPMGYCKGEDGRYALVENEAEIVREIFRRVRDGEALASIANNLNERGIRTKRGGSWGKNSFHRILTNEIYIGVYSYSDIRIENSTPPIVDKALFLEVAQHLKTRKTKRRNRGNGEYILTGKLFCGHCGTPMVGISGTSRSGELYYYYICQKRRLKHACEKVNVSREWIERVVVQATLEYILRDDVIQWIADAVMAYQERESNTAVLIGLREQLAENKREIDNVLKAIRAGVITASTQKLLVELESEGSRLEDAICLEEAALTHIEREFIVYWLEQFRGGSADDATFRALIIDTFINSVYLWDDQVRIAFNYSGKGNTIDSALVLDAESVAGQDMFVYPHQRCTKPQQSEPFPERGWVRIIGFFEGFERNWW